MCEMVDRVVVPGDILEHLEGQECTEKQVIGPGLRRHAGSIIATKPGIVRQREPNVYWVDCHQKRYVPARGENVLGIITMKAGDVFRVDIGASEQASLSYLAFEGATKRNRPDVRVGDLVYCKLLVANKDMEPEVVCMDSTGRSSGLGVVRDEGFMFHCSLNLVRKILSPDCPLLQFLGNKLPYETAVGQNGRVWVKGRSCKETIAIANAICSAEYMSGMQIKVMVQKLVDALSGF